MLTSRCSVGSRLPAGPGTDEGFYGIFYLSGIRQYYRSSLPYMSGVKFEIHVSKGLIQSFSKALAAGPGKSHSVCFGQADFENGCKQTIS